jgi:hypothetical protein
MHHCKKLKPFFLQKNRSSTQQVIMSEIITEPSICIPRTLNNVTRQQVKEVFEIVIGRGTVERVDIVSNRQNDGQPFCRIFVHFRFWPNTTEIMSIRQSLLDGNTIRVVYDNPWFWRCSASRVPKPINNRPKTVPFIESSGEVVATPTPDEVTSKVIRVAPTSTTVGLPADEADEADEDSRSPSPSPVRRSTTSAACDDE